MRTVQILVLSIFIAALGLSCAGEPGERALTTFGNAVQSGDELAAEQVSLVEFPGTVSTWEIIEIGPESSEPFQLMNLIEERREMAKELEAMIAKTNNFLQDNEELSYEYKALTDKDPERTFTGELEVFDEEFTALLKDQTDQDAKIEEAGDAIDALKAAAALSTSTPGVGSTYDGDVLERTAKVKADGKDYTITLKHYVLINTEHNIRPMTHWIITDIQG